MEKGNLKPVIFESGYSYHRNNKFQQNLLLKALAVTSDPKELRKMAGLKSVADVYRTLDKMSLRKEYHEALARQGISLDKIISGIRDIAEGSHSDSVRLKGYQTLLRSVGLDRYDEIEDVGKGWEDILIKQSQEKTALPQPDEDYKVIPPPMPEEERKRIESEKIEGKGLYDR
jgi:hypothetical protein